MPKVNGIPTAHEFKKKLGRTGISKVVKKSDPQIEEILATLQNAGYWRGVNTPNALPPLRLVRKACIAWIGANQNNTRASRPLIKDLCDAVHLRITTVIEFNFAKSKVQHQMAQTRMGMHAVFDEIRLRRGGGLVGRGLDTHYGVERGTSSHVPKPSGDQARAKYNQAKQSGNTSLDLEDWITQVLIPQAEEDPFNFYFDNMQTVNNFHLTSLKGQRVKYCTPEERGDYELSFLNGLIYDADGNPYHTGAKETAFSGFGWAIYVVDFDDTFYSESHIVNEFHHSSFLAGAPVQAAGEIAVDRGHLVAITNKTGHYKAGPNELARALEILQANLIDLATVKVNDPFAAQGKWFSGRAALSANGKLADLPDLLKVQPPTRVTNND